MIIRPYIAQFTLGLVVAACFAGQAQVGAKHYSPTSGSHTASSPVSFLNDIEPILTRAACNSGACHGSQFGKGGFKLSLAAYDPDLDYESIAKQSGSRRLNLIEPVRSLLLRKPALQVTHAGGLKLPPGTADFQSVLRWLRQGAPGPSPKDPKVVALTAIPRKQMLSPRKTLVLKVFANFSDGSQRDVTAHTRINTLDESVATSTPDGRVTAVGRGATAIMLRYSGLAAVSEILVPYDRAPQRSNNPTTKRPTINSIVEAKWREMGLTPSGACTDYEFIRRASLDIIGTRPTPDEVRDFGGDKDPQKRVNLVTRLVERPEFADYWTVKWADLLRSSRTTLGPKSSASLTEWIRSALSRNVPFNQMVKELLTAQGPTYSAAPANYFRVASTPDELTETTSQLFLGVRLQCARCHHHPFEKWSQGDYYQFAAFFARTGQRKATGDEVMVNLRNAGEVLHPKSRATMTPAPLAMESSPPFRSDDLDRREALANWLVSPGNLQFARTLVNRYWAYFLGREIVDPVDDVRITNPPSNPELLDALAKDFIRNGFDLKQLVRSICSSRAYSISSRSTPNNHPDRKFYSHFLPRRQPAEVLLDSIGMATGVREKFTGHPAGMRAIQLPDSAVVSMFLDTFGRPPRSSACECERSTEPSLPQALQLLNGESLNQKVTAPFGKAAALAASANPAQVIVDELYLSTLNRPPTPGELNKAIATFEKVPRRQACEDILWALLNTKEFSTIR